MNDKMPDSPLPNMVWFKSSYSSGEGGECVEVATAGGAVHVRDSKFPVGPNIAVSPEAWAGLVALAIVGGG